MISKVDLLFLDANIFFAATASEHGASRALFRLAEKKLLAVVTNEYALIEAKVNLIRKLGEASLSQFYRLVSILSAIDKVRPSAAEVNRLSKFINTKDLPILASALRTKADYLISLDRKAFFSEPISKRKLLLNFMLPGDYMKFFLGL